MDSTNQAASAGLGSPQGIRWLLAVGALVMMVSALRLVETQWSGLPVTAQFATLTTGALAVFGSAQLLARRLRLPMAGAALELLFAALVPVLFWGASYLRLVTEPFGIGVYVSSAGVLLLALRRCLGDTLRYEGVGYWAAFGTLSAALPLWSLLTPSTGSAMLVTSGLGGVLYLGSRHINRFLFHRDRRDGVDRPLHVLPFVALAVIYLCSVHAVGLPFSHVALPLVILGMSFVSTGEEYYRALQSSLGTRPRAWPRRSVVLLSVGFGLMAVSVPLSVMDASRQLSALVLVAIGALLLRWSRRYESAAARVCSLLAGIVAYQLLPAWIPELPREAMVHSLDRLGLADIVAKTAFAHLGLSAVLAWFAGSGDSSVVRAHRRVSVVYLCGLSSLSAWSGASVVAPLALVVGLAAFARSRAPSFVVAAQLAMGIWILASFGDHAMAILALVSLGVALLERRAPALRAQLLVPSLLWSCLVACWAIANVTTGGGVELFCAGLVFAAVGVRVVSPEALGVGLALLSSGIHAVLHFDLAAPRAVLVATTLASFVVVTAIGRRLDPKIGLGVLYASLGHVVPLSLLWLALAVLSGNVGIEPMVLALFGWAIVTSAELSKERLSREIGLSLIVIYLPFHLYVASVVSSGALLLLITLAVLAAFCRFGSSELREAASSLVGPWRFAAVVVALITTGAASFVLALALALVVSSLSPGKLPFRSALLALAHGFILLSGGGGDFFVAALVESASARPALFALVALSWLLYVELAGERGRRRWSIAVEAMSLGFVLFASAPSVGDPRWLGLFGIALAFAAFHTWRSLETESHARAWSMVLWVFAATFLAHRAGWWSFGLGRAPFVLLGAAAAQYGLAQIWQRFAGGTPLSEVSRRCGITLALVGGGVAVWRMQSAALFAASLFHLLLRGRHHHRGASSIFTSFYFGLGLVALVASNGLGVEFYALAPGASLIALSGLLAREMGPRLSRHMFTVGAAFVYTTPVLALYDEITWGWQVVLLLTTVVFGATSFWLRSRPLLTVSTAALVIDLSCFVIKIRASEPLLLWAGGVVLGVVLMSFAAYLEHRREGFTQQIRVFGQELAAWY